MSVTFLSLLVHVALQTGFILRALLRRHREPASRIAWVLIILVLPVVGMTAYLLFGETNIGRTLTTRYRAAEDTLRRLSASASNDISDWPAALSHPHLFRVGYSISGFAPSAGNHAEVMTDANSAIAALIADIDAAQNSVNLLYFIWLVDRNGLAVVEAVKRAAHRGVTVRVMADDVGSRHLIRSPHWHEMAQAGVHTARMLPVGNPLLRILRSRLDLRNHRKIAVIDRHVTYCGSQNCADPEFLVKRKYAPWIDILVRLEGPVAAQNERLFLQDWLAHVDEDLPVLPPPSDVPAPAPADPPGTVAQVIGTGSMARPSAMPEMFEALIYAAREELIITTPYYVPTEPIQAAIEAAARRGVRTCLVLPARNDSRIVAAASRSYYNDLAEAGVRLYEYPLGLLHAKSMTLDGTAAMIGSANLDRRSFELNFENNILLEGPQIVTAIRARQMEYIAASDLVTLSDIGAWGIRRRLWANTVAMIGPVL